MVTFGDDVSFVACYERSKTCYLSGDMRYAKPFARQLHDWPTTDMSVLTETVSLDKVMATTTSTHSERDTT